MTATNKCSICQQPSEPYCRTTVLGKYDIQYFRCTHCNFIQTESPYWLEEAYNSAITKLDIGLVVRNEIMAPVVQATINRWFNKKGEFVDYGGGYGLLVRMMRDRGFNFYRQDVHCKNLFAESFDISDVPPFKADVLTAFEVFEHLVDPVPELVKMLAISDTILFSTTVQPSPNVTPESWWYFTPETGQHIALYSHKSLQLLANRFGMNYYWNEQDVHLFSRRKISHWEFKLITHPRWGKLYNLMSIRPSSLLHDDFNLIQKKLKANLQSVNGK